MNTQDTDPKATPDIRLLLDVYKVPLFLVGGSIFLLVVSIVLLVKSVQTTTPIKFIPASEASVGGVAVGGIVVDIAGGVGKPGVYTLAAGSRLDDAIAAAGGLSDEADTELIGRQMNRAMVLFDGMKIYVPKKGESKVSQTSQGKTSYNLITNTGGGSQNGSVSINSASQSELESLPGVGPVTAQKIISNRPYGTLEELVSKKAVGQKLFDQIKGAISL